MNLKYIIQFNCNKFHWTTRQTPIWVLILSIKLKQKAYTSWANLRLVWSGLGKWGFFFFWVIIPTWSTDKSTHMKNNWYMYLWSRWVGSLGLVKSHLALVDNDSVDYPYSSSIWLCLRAQISEQSVARRSGFFFGSNRRSGLYQAFMWPIVQSYFIKNYWMMSCPIH